MSADRPVQPPVAAPPLAETGRLLPDRLFDMIGGWRTVLLFVALAVVVIGVDLSLAQILDFPPACLPGFPTHAGGFALMLAGLLVVTLWGLQVVAPRSLAFSYFFLIAVSVSLQIMVAKSETIPLLIEAFAWPRWLYQTMPTCAPDPLSGFTDPLALREFLLYRYAATGTDLIPDFTAGLAANLALLAAAAVVVWVGAVFVLVWQAIARLFRRPAPRRVSAKFAGWRRMNRTERAVVVLAAGITVLVAMAGPAMLVLLSDNPQDFSLQVKDLLWIGPLLFLADLARLAWPEPSLDTFATQVETPVTVTVPLVLPALVQSMRKTFPQRAVMDLMIARQPGARTDPDAAGPLPLPAPGTAEFHESSLLRWHLDRLVRVANRAVLDAGRTALVVCPIEAQRGINDELETRFRIDPGPGIVRIWSDGQPLEAGDDLELIIVTPESLSRLLDNAVAYQGFLERLGGIFVIDFHRLDLGLLHVALTRLKQHVRAPDSIVAMFQAERRGGLSDWIKNLPLPRTKSILRMDRPAPSVAIDQHVVLALPGRSDSPDGDAGLWPTRAQLMVHALRTAPQAEPYHFDEHARHVPSQWENILRRLRNETDQSIANRAAQLQHPVLLPINHAHPFAVIDDAGNLVDCLGAEITAPTSLEALRIVMRGTYPAAIFLHDQIEQARRKAGTSATGLRNALDELRGKYGSLTPEPVGGPVEVAMMLKQEILKRRNDGSRVGQRQMESIWPKPDSVLRQLHVANTRAGIERLFQIALQIPGTDGFLESELRPDRTLTYALAADVISRGMAFETLKVRVRDTVQQGRSADPAWRGEVRVLADHGLSYMKGSRFVLDGRICEVDEVDIHRREVHVRYREEAALREHTFVRDYAFLTAAQSKHGFAAERLSAKTNCAVPMEMASGYMQVARQTRGFYTHLSDAAPHDENGKLGDVTNGEARSALHLRSVAVLQIYNRDAVPVAPRRGRLPGVARARSQAGAVSAQVAFTLATTLQDILQTCFPLHAHRLAVLCPQAQGDAALFADDPHLRFAVDRQPLLQALNELTGTVAARGPRQMRGVLDADLTSSLEGLAETFLNLARRQTGGEEPGFPVALTLFVVEDSDHDLGIVRSIIAQNHATVLDRWEGYLSHCCQTQGTGQDFAYAFGDKRVPACFDFPGALQIVKGMKNVLA